MGFVHRFLVHALKLLEIDRCTERVVDLLELGLVSRLVYVELGSVQTNQAWNTHPRLCQQSDGDGDVSVFDDNMVQHIASSVRIQTSALCIVNNEEM